MRRAYRAPKSSPRRVRPARVGGTYTGNERWDAYAQIVGGIRAWLEQLPSDVAEAIAHGNAERFLAQLSR